MRYLYVLLLLSLAALLWAAWAIAKHVRSHPGEDHRGQELPDAESVAGIDVSRQSAIRKSSHPQDEVAGNGRSQ